MQRWSRKCVLFTNETNSLNQILGQGSMIGLSQIHDIINYKCGETIKTNKEVILYLVEHFLDTIQFCPSKHKSESLFMFSSKLSMKDVFGESCP